MEFVITLIIHALIIAIPVVFLIYVIVDRSSQKKREDQENFEDRSN